jgi:hypothetical protein
MNTNPSRSTNPNITQPTSPISNILELPQQSMSHVPDVPTIPPVAYQATSIQTTTTFPSPKRKCLVSHVPTVPRSHTSSAPNIPTTRPQHNHTSLHTNLNVPCPECLKQPTYIFGIICTLGSLSNPSHIPNVSSPKCPRHPGSHPLHTSQPQCKSQQFILTSRMSQPSCVLHTHQNCCKIGTPLWGGDGLLKCSGTGWRCGVDGPLWVPGLGTPACNQPILSTPPRLFPLFVIQSTTTMH